MSAANQHTYTGRARRTHEDIDFAEQEKKKPKHQKTHLATQRIRQKTEDRQRKVIRFARFKTNTFPRT